MVTIDLILRVPLEPPQMGKSRSPGRARLSQVYAPSEQSVITSKRHIPHLAMALSQFTTIHPP